MKKLNRREKTIVRLMALVVAVAVFSEGWEKYQVSRENLEANITNLQNQIVRMGSALEKESAESYLEEARDIEEELTDARTMILELPNERNASLLMRSTISDLAQAAGVNVNSINSRPARVVKEGSDLQELKVYFGWEADLPELLRFFSSLEDREFYLAVENVNITAVRKRKGRQNQRNSKVQERKGLNGNAILMTLFKPNPDATGDRYFKDSAAVKEKAAEKAAEQAAEQASAKARGDDPVDSDGSDDDASEVQGGLKEVSADDDAQIDVAPGENKLRPTLQPEPMPLTRPAKPNRSGKKPESGDKKKIKGRF